LELQTPLQEGAALPADQVTPCMAHDRPSRRSRGYHNEGKHDLQQQKAAAEGSSSRQQQHEVSDAVHNHLRDKQWKSMSLQVLI
jgi:hypothetical protein